MFAIYQVQLEVGFSNDPNLHRSLGHATILEPKIDKDGNFTGFLFDKYDYDLLYKSYKNNLLLATANNYFWFRGLNPLKNRNYYIIIPVKFKW